MIITAGLLVPQLLLLTALDGISARFLGYEITVRHSDHKLTRGRREVNGDIALRVPLAVIKAKTAPYMTRGKPAHRSRLMNEDDLAIISAYGAEYRGIVQYYLLAGDVWRLNRLRWAAETSLLKTLAAKHRSTVPKMAARYGAVIATPHGPRRCFQASIDRGEGRKPLVARFGGIPLKRQRKAVLTDRQPVPARPCKELIRRLLADRCELCGHAGPTEVHQVRKLADLAKPGQPQPGWAELMAKRRRKALPVCQACHGTIHAGQPAATSTQKSPESHVR